MLCRAKNTYENPPTPIIYYIVKLFKLVCNFELTWLIFMS